MDRASTDVPLASKIDDWGRWFMRTYFVGSVSTLSFWTLMVLVGVDFPGQDHDVTPHVPVVERADVAGYGPGQPRQSGDTVDRSSVEIGNVLQIEAVGLAPSRAGLPGVGNHVEGVGESDAAIPNHRVRQFGERRIAGSGPGV